MDYKHQFDIAFSMEFLLLYLKVLKYVHDHLLKPGGCMIMGVDHYKENKSSLSWSKDLDLTLKHFLLNSGKIITNMLGLNIKLISLDLKKIGQGH